MNESPKLCIDCVHRRGGGFYLTCGRHTKFNLVDGSTIYSHYLCPLERGQDAPWEPNGKKSDDPCGPEGKYWVARPKPPVPPSPLLTEPVIEDEGFFRNTIRSVFHHK